jgi:predicted glycosyltransferase
MIDIGHPAHVHYFRNFIKIMERKGHTFLIIAKNKNVTHELLEHYEIKFISRKDYPKSILGKLLQIPLTDLRVLKHAVIFKPDILMGFSGTHISHVGWTLGIPAIVFDDTDHAKLAHASYRPFAKCIITPKWFKKNMEKKHIRFDSYMELCALHPKYFKPDPSVLSKLKLGVDEEYIVLRFVSWSASHDIGQKGFSDEMKRKIIEEYKTRFRIFISAEGEIPKDLQKYKLNIPAYNLHDILSYAKLYVGEGSTTACESAILGTPAIYCNSLDVGNCKEIEDQYGLCFKLTELKDIMSKMNELLEPNNSKQIFDKQKNRIIKDKINTTDFMVWLIENYPSSVSILKNNPDYQYKFI